MHWQKKARHKVRIIQHFRNQKSEGFNKTENERVVCMWDISFIGCEPEKGKQTFENKSCLWDQYLSRKSSQGIS